MGKKIQNFEYIYLIGEFPGITERIDRFLEKKLVLGFRGEEFLVGGYREVKKCELKLKRVMNLEIQFYNFLFFYYRK